MKIKEGGVMDIQGKKAFEIAFDNKLGARSCQFDLDEDGNYEDRDTLCGWHMWLEAKAQAVPEGFILVSAEQMSQWGHMANYAEQYGCPECFEARGYVHSLACEINAYFNVSEAQEPAND